MVALSSSMRWLAPPARMMATVIQGTSMHFFEFIKGGLKLGQQAPYAVEQGLTLTT
jgi:hypothetical protein